MNYGLKNPPDAHFHLRSVPSSDFERSAWLMQHVSRESLATARSRVSVVTTEKQKLDTDISLLQNEIVKVKNWLARANHTVIQKGLQKTEISNCVNERR